MAGGTREAMLHLSIPYHRHHHAHNDYVTVENYHRHPTSTDAHQHQHHALGTGAGPGDGYRHPSYAPLRKLTVDLIKTYRKINDVSVYK